MSQKAPFRLTPGRALGILALFALNAVTAADQSVKIQGLIKQRSGPAMILQTADSPKLIVLLTDKTKVSQLQGLLKARKKDMSMAALIPGLAVEIEASYDDQRQLVADSVKFKGNDLKDAQAIQAGLHETKMQAQQNSEELQRQNAELQAHNEALEKQQRDLTAHQQELNSQQQKIASNKAAIAAALARFGQLDDYYILDELTIRFGNGKVEIEPQYKPQLLELAQKAKTIDSYMVQIIGYASSSGSAALNQKLSEDRANNIANFLIQDGYIPLTNMLAPGAMGESRQVGDDKTAEGQAENRRVVIRILQNKGIAGLQTVTR